MERNCYWITAIDPDTQKPYLIFGSPNSEEEARQRGMEMLGGLDFKIHRLPTRNLQRASSLLKGNRLEKTQSLKKAAERLGHERGLLRDKARKQHKKKNPDSVWD